MKQILFSLVFLVLGLGSLCLRYKTSKTKTVELDVNKLINPAMLKYKDEIFKTNLRFYLILGIVATTQGIVGLVSCYIPSIHFVFDVLNIILIMVIVAYTFMTMKIFCKS